MHSRFRVKHLLPAALVTRRAALIGGGTRRSRSRRRSAGATLVLMEFGNDALERLEPALVLQQAQRREDIEAGLVAQFVEPPRAILTADLAQQLLQKFGADRLRVADRIGG